MKRFTATEKWDKEWFMDLSCKHKVLWQFLCDSCDCAGVWEPNWKLASYQIGEKVKVDDLKVFGERVIVLDNGKVLLTNFVSFQYGTLSRDCRPHQNIIRAIEKHGVSSLVDGHPDFIASETPTSQIPYAKGIQRDKEKEKEKEEDKEQDMDKETVPVPPRSPEAELLDHLNKTADRHFRHTPENLKLIRSRLSSVDDDKPGVLKMIDRMAAKWRGDPKMSEFLRPTTLFGKEKFSEYYDLREVPVNGNHHYSDEADEGQLF
jgi:uncharacterized phage protein (TIGR02220 family)